MNKKKPPEAKLSKALIGFWPLAPILLLPTIAYAFTFPFLHLLDADRYTTSLDKNFWITAIVVLFGHIIAFSIIPLLVIKRNLVTSKEQISSFSIAGFIALLIQCSLRIASDSIQRVDCFDKCEVRIMPVFPGMILTVLTLVSLIALLVTFLIVIRSGARIPKQTR